MQYEIREMGVSEILDTGFRLVRRHFVLLVSLGFIVALPAQLIALLLESTMRDGADVVAAVAGLTGGLLGLLIVSPIVQTAITYALAEFYQGRSASFGDAIRVALSLFFPVIGTSVLTGLAVLAGLMLLILPGLYVIFALLLVYQIVVIERVYALDAMKRSQELMAGSLWRGVGLMLVVGIVTTVVTLAVSMTLGLLPMAGPIANALVSAVTMAFQSAVLLVLYFDLRCRHEAFDLEHLARAVESGGR